MEKSNVEKITDALLYAPVGAISFAKDNLPTFFGIFVTRGKRDIIKTTQNAEDKISSTKEHGQLVAMGTPIVKSKAERIAGEAKNKGEDLAHATIDIALGAVGAVESLLKSVTSSLNLETDNATKTTSPRATNLSAAASIPTNETLADNVAALQEVPEQTHPIVIDRAGSTFVPSEYVAEKSSSTTNPVENSLPSKIRADYAKLSAPEIIDRLDDFDVLDLTTIKNHESEFRNRQTIIHAINFRIDSNS